MDEESSKRLALLLERQATELDNAVGWLRDVSNRDEQNFYVDKIAHILAISNDVFDKIYSLYPELKRNSKVTYRKREINITMQIQLSCKPAAPHTSSLWVCG